MSGFTERDVLRVERKIAKAMNEKREQRALDNYASEKIKNLYNFMSKVESDQESWRGSVPSLANLDMVESQVFDEHKDKENFNGMNYKQSRSQLFNLKAELDDAHKTIDSLRKTIENEKVRNKELEIMHEEREEKRLRDQKEELEAVIQRHLTFIDQLVADKKELNDQVEKLVQELKELETKHSSQITELRDKFQRELKENKDAWVAAEKQRKEKWIHDKTAEIKEVTIRGLEPEIERLLTKSKLEAKKLEERHQKELATIREELYTEYEGKLRQYKEKVLRENDESMVKEREYLSTKMKEQYDKIEQQYLEDRDKLKKTYDVQLDNVEDARRKDKETFEDKLKKLQDEHTKEVRRVKEELEEVMEYQKAKHRKEIENMREETKAEQARWIEKQNRRLDEEFESKFKKAKAELEKQRDDQIEMIIQKLGDERADEGFDLKGKYDNRLDELKEAHEEEVKKLKREIFVLESQIKEKEAMSHLAVENLDIVSKKLIDAQTKLDTRERDNSGMKTALDSTKKELDKMMDVHKETEASWRRRFESQKIELNTEIEKMYEEMKDLRRQYEKEIEALEERHANVLEDVEVKVKRAIMKKDHDLIRLKEELQVKASACAKYEELLEKQRKDFSNL